MKLPFVSRKKYEDVVTDLKCLLCYAAGGVLEAGDVLTTGNYNMSDMERMVDNHIESRVKEAVEEAVAAAKAESLSEWISVDNRPPAENEATLISTKLGEVYQARYKQGVWTGPYGMTWTAKHVTHWQPLPKPAKSRRR